MSKPIENALIEASNPETNPERLQKLSQWKQENECNRLRQTIAANPNCDESLLFRLAAEYTREVIDNPRFQLLQISEEPWWEDCELISLLMLLAEMGPNAPRRMRGDFFKLLGAELISTDQLAMNKEWHMGFSQDITIEWSPSPPDDVEEDDPDEGEEADQAQESWVDGADAGESQQQDFSIDFSCVVEENFWFLTPPASLDDPVGCLEALIAVNSREELLAVLEKHGWEEEYDSTPGGQGYWAIESLTPELVDWDFDANLFGDGSGIVQVTDPSGKIHEISIEAPDDCGHEYLNPTLEDFPDFIASVFDKSGKTTAELCNLLHMVIVVERQSGATKSNPCQS